MKHNLAKVLGMEEYNEEPNIRVEPTEDEVIQIEQDKFVQEMADHSEATAEALEAIGNAQALASVIARNNSTDKTTYELLKVAVEQLKEKTGVKTESVSLESLDKTSYKTEALQDIKDFIKKVIEAIKKAFLSMWEKIKAFFKSIFSKAEDVEKETKESIKDLEELEKEISKAPKTPEQAKNYSSDYFSIKKNYFEETKGSGSPALGYTPGTTNKTTVGGFKLKDKDADYSGKEYDRIGTDESDPESDYSRTVYQYLGFPVKSNDRADFATRLKKYSSEIIDLNDLYKRYAFSNIGLSVVRENEDIEYAPMPKINHLIKKGKFSLGDYSYQMGFEEGAFSLKIDKENDSVKMIDFLGAKGMRDALVPFLETLTSRFKDFYPELKKKMEDYQEWIGEMKTIMDKNADRFESRKEELSKISSSFNDILNTTRTIVSGYARFTYFINQICKAVLLCMRQTIERVKRAYSFYLKRDGYIRDIKELEDAGWVNG